MANKLATIEEKEAITHQPDFWENPKEAQKVLQEISAIKTWTDAFQKVATKVEDLEVLYEFFREGESTEEEVEESYQETLVAIEELEFKNMLSEEEDRLACVLEINAGAGGTESQDWTEMLKRMYIMYANNQGFKTSLINEVEGDTAGIKSCSLEISGPFAYGYLKSENGVHRLVRVSPFDSSARRHTSFASVYVFPKVDDSISIEVNPADVTFTTFHSSGKGGQNVNKVETAVRLVHEPTKLVVECQQERSQLRNREKAMELLKSRLYQLELQKRDEERAQIEGSKMKIEWGSQIRSYVLDDRRVKDHRTGHQTSNTDAVLNGEIDEFIKAYLMEFGNVSQEEA